MSPNTEDLEHAHTSVQDHADQTDEEWEEGSNDSDDLETEAEAMARRLQEQLRADIERAQQEARLHAAATSHIGASTQQANNAAAPGIASSSTATTIRQATSEPSLSSAETSDLRRASPLGNARERKSTAAILTMKAILASAERNPLVHSTLAGTIVPGDDRHNVLGVFNDCVSCKRISKGVAKRLSEVIISLAKSEVLFASLRNSDAPAIQLDKGKRRWDAIDGPAQHAAVQDPPPKRIAIDQPDLRYQISEAVRIVTQAVAPMVSSQTSMIHPPLIVSIYPQLHQAFLFAVTSAPRAGERTVALQELGGLIQMLGVLSGTPIGTHPSNSQAQAWGHPQPQPFRGPSNIETAVYPCLFPSCEKVFHRLYSLKAHQRLHTLVERPYRCKRCPANFARNHDLKRHTRLHEKRAWRCAGCGKVFSRRDAIKRHKDNRRLGGRGAGKAAEGRDGGDELVGVAESVCAYAEVEEVEVDRPDGDGEAGRRAKMWDGIAATQMSTAGSNSNAVYPGHPVSMAGLDDDLEEGEVHPGILFEAQTIVLQLRHLLQRYVTKALGHPPVLQGQSMLPQQTAGPAPPPALGNTLVSIIAQAQSSPSGSVPSTPGPAGAQSVVKVASESVAPVASSSLSSALSLSEEQTRLLEQAIAQAALVAQAQAEAEAALEEEGDEGTDDEEDEE